MTGALYVNTDYWVFGYTELSDGSPETPTSGTRGFGGWNYTEEELRALAEGARRRRIKAQIDALERQLAIEMAWAEQMEPVATAAPPAAAPIASPPAAARRPVRNVVSPRHIEARLGSTAASLEEDEITSLLLLGA